MYDGVRACGRIKICNHLQTYTFRYIDLMKEIQKKKGIFKKKISELLSITISVSPH